MDFTKAELYALINSEKPLRLVGADLSGAQYNKHTI